MKLWFSSFLLILSGFLAILFPKQVQSMANYPSQVSLIRGWGIYGLAIGIIFALNNIEFSDESEENVVPGVLLGVFILSIIWETYTGICKNRWCSYLIAAIIVNLIGIAEISYYLTDDKTFIETNPVN